MLHILSLSEAMLILLYLKDMLLTNNHRGWIDKMELAQHLQEMGLDVEYTKQLVCNHLYHKKVDHLYPMLRGIKILDFK